MGAPPEGGRSRSRLLLIGLAGVLLVAAAAAVAIIVASNSGSSDQNSTYRQQLTSALAPVMVANRAMSSALQSLDGSGKSIQAAQTATSQAQSAVIAARAAR